MKLITLLLVPLFVLSLAADDAPVALVLSPKADCLDSAGHSASCRLGSRVVIGAPNLPAWMAANKSNKPIDLMLVLNGRVMKGLSECGSCANGNQLVFTLSRLEESAPDGPENRAAWRALLAGAKGDRTMTVGVGLNGAAPWYSGSSLVFSTFPGYSWLIGMFVFALLVVFVYLARKSDIVRDPGPDPGPGNRRAYSLARCQMAFWFFVILAGFNFIWMVIGDHDSLTTGVLILMGISSATGLSSAVLDSSKTGERQTLERRRTTLAAQIAAGPAPADLAPLQQQLVEANAALSNLPAPPAPSENFFQDILSDDTGVSFHRFQMAAWTVVLGFVFIVSVSEDLAMPDFSATLLGLMGISAGTYVGFKIPNSPK